MKRKDWTHTAVQNSLLSIIPGAKLEQRFPMIRRIADVVVPSEKLIFEIQCSPITLEEVQNRNRDYESIGFTVIWILHQHKFNKEFITPAERCIRKGPSYFTSITPYGPGFFYDQLEFFDGLRRIYKGPPLILESLLPRNLVRMLPTFPKFLKKKLTQSPIYLPGDLTDHLIKRSGSNWARILEKNHTLTPFKKLLQLARDFFHYQLFLTADRRFPSSVHTPEAKQNKETPRDIEQNKFQPS